MLAQFGLLSQLRELDPVSLRVQHLGVPFVYRTERNNWFFSVSCHCFRVGDVISQTLVIYVLVFLAFMIYSRVFLP